LQVAHLDFALYPFFVVAILACFARGVDERRLDYVAVSALVFTVYFTMTLSAAALFAALIPYLGLVAFQRLRRGATLEEEARAAGKAVGVFAAVCGVVLLASYALLHFDPVTRYGYARGVQRDWTTSEYNSFWVTSNLLGYALSFGLIYVVCVIVQQWRSVQRLVSGSADSIDNLTIAWLCLLVGLVVFGRQHGETNRLWAFLNPVGCLIAARPLSDSIRRSWLWVPVPLALVALLLARDQLSYF
jgi:hypothetical protein